MATSNVEIRYPMVEEDLKTYAEVKENLEAKGSCKFCIIWLQNAIFLMYTLQWDMILLSNASLLPIITLHRSTH